MAKQLFLIQIVNVNDGTVVQLPGGGLLERNLIDAVTQRVVSKGVGFLKTEAKVKLAIEEGFAEAIRELKLATRAVA